MIKSSSTDGTVALVLTLGLSTVSAQDYSPIAGYTPVSDVVSNSELDLDTAEMEECTDAFNWDCAYEWYSEGGNSVKGGSGDALTLQSLSLTAQELLSKEKWFQIYRVYWNDDPAYADTFTGGACQGTGDFAGTSDLTRSECCLKGAQYQNVWMYVIHELEDAINDCEIGDLEANHDGQHAWDEAWAYYAGSLEGTTGSDDGQHIYALAQKRCGNLGTCTGDSDGVSYAGTAAVNAQLLELYYDGQDKLLSGECDSVEAIKERIVELMTVPLIQGMLRYFHKADSIANPSTNDKDAAELWAFSAAALPRIYDCDTRVAQKIRFNTEITSDSAAMSDGYLELKEALETVYSCLGITCADVGGMLHDAAAGTYVSGMEPCTDDDENDAEGLPLWGLLIIIIVGVVVVAFGASCCLRRRCKRSPNLEESDGIGGFALKTASTI